MFVRSQVDRLVGHKGSTVEYRAQPLNHDLGRTFEIERRDA
jgi:hypothetical protein